MKQEIYFKHFEIEEIARDHMVKLNRACRRSGDKQSMFCLVPGPDGDCFSVVDIGSAIELDLGYTWEV